MYHQDIILAVIGVNFADTYVDKVFNIQHNCQKDCTIYFYNGMTVSGLMLITALMLKINSLSPYTLNKDNQKLHFQRKVILSILIFLYLP